MLQTVWSLIFLTLFYNLLHLFAKCAVNISRMCLLTPVFPFIVFNRLQINLKHIGYPHCHAATTVKSICYRSVNTQAAGCRSVINELEGMWKEVAMAWYEAGVLSTIPSAWLSQTRTLRSPRPYSTLRPLANEAGGPAAICHFHYQTNCKSVPLRHTPLPISVTSVRPTVGWQAYLAYTHVMPFRSA
jgi:hypothetical protein